MSFGVMAVCIQTYVQFRFLKFRRLDDLRLEETSENTRIRDEILTWEKVKSSLQTSGNGQDQALALRNATDIILDHLNESLKCVCTNSRLSFEIILKDLERKYPIRNKVLLVQSSVCLVFVLGLFFLHSVPQLQRLSLGWIALIGALLLLILIDSKDIDSILGKVEWSTLLFFAGLFIIIEVNIHWFLIGPFI